VAIAAQKAGHALGTLNPTLYALSSGIVDVTAGDNGVVYVQHGKRVIVPGYSAVTGYDLASGLGTVDGALLVNALAP
jgi:kumamolisin